MLRHDGRKRRFNLFANGYLFQFWCWRNSDLPKCLLSGQAVLEEAVHDKFDLWVRELAKGPDGAPVSKFPGRRKSLRWLASGNRPGEKREDLLTEGECMAAANKRGAGWRVVTAEVTLYPKRLVTLGKKEPSQRLDFTQLFCLLRRPICSQGRPWSSRCDETGHPFIKGLGVEPPHVADAIFIGRAKSRPGRPTDEPHGYGFRSQLKCWFLKQIIEATRHAQSPALRTQTPGRTHPVLQGDRATVPPRPGDQVPQQHSPPIRSVPRGLHDGVGIIALQEIRGRQPMQPRRLLRGPRTRMASACADRPAAPPSLAPGTKVTAVIGNRVGIIEVIKARSYQAQTNSNACASQPWARFHARRSRPPASGAGLANRAGIS